MADLPKELRIFQDDIEKYARDYGLDFFTTVFEILDFEQLNQVASYGGFPTRYPHWSFGMEYERLSKSYSYGLSKIYEMVINNDPVVAYLLKSNAVMDQKLVMAHVFGHADFFKNNYYFSVTNRKAVDMMANHGVKIRRYVEKLGYDRVEAFIDTCLTLENLIDPHGNFMKRTRSPEADSEQDFDPSRIKVPKLRSKDYMDKFINPPEFLEQQKQKIIDEQKRERGFPDSPQQDVLQFLIDYAPLENWERDILSIIREEAYYFLPQGQTKVMNEGWASYWHTTIMTNKAMTDSEVIDYADHHSGTVSMAGGRFNPYKIGLELFRDIEDRWNKGKFGSEYDNCTNMVEKKNWDRKLGKGKEKIFEVRKIYNDVTFLDEFLTPEFCAEHKLFTFQMNPKSNEYEIASREFEKIKKQLLFQLANMGRPRIFVSNANYQNRGELYLWHQFEGVELKLETAKETLMNLHKCWRRPVHIQTRLDEHYRLLSFDGKDLTERTLSKDDAYQG
ncbi:MAG: SpoVR family protein [Deltaproteobacteria bacterium]|nr:SpoVR family protein [Deltaproteobacteria bacterium]